LPTFHTSVSSRCCASATSSRWSAAGLGIALVVAISLAATRDREVVLVPTLRKQLTVSSAGVEADYLELVTRDAALCSSIAAPRASTTGWTRS
jgi:hypothetical protein